MNDFEEQRPSRRTAGSMSGAAGSGATGSGSGSGSGSVHQVVFRWDGNQGRQGTGMTAVAHSCPAGRAEELGRELGPLLWVSGTAAPRQSVVRVLSRDGDVMLVQRWPTTDRGGRPSTVSHVLIGDPKTLKTRQCLGLAHGGWGSRESAEKAAGRLRAVESAELDAVARKRLPGMRQQLPTVRNALILVTAEWLRDPAQRVSLLTDEAKQPGWPDQDAAPLVYLGLFMLFGSWLGHEWTFATYDTVDTHQLRLTSVPRWEPDAGGSGPLARVMGRSPANPQFEHMAAARLVDHVLAHPADGPGVPQLIDGLRDGAGLEWARRRLLLKEILYADRREPPRSATAAPTSTPTAPEPEPEPEPAPVPAPVSPREREREWEPEREREREPEPTPRPTSEPALATGYPLTAHEARSLHAELRVHRRGNITQRGLLADRLRTLSDELLLDELRSAELPQDSVELLLDELGGDHRVRVRRTSVQHELCAEVLRNGLYYTPNRQDAEPLSRTAMAKRAADLFTWAVAPLARDERYLRDLQELLHRMVRDRHPTAGNWLWQSVITPGNGLAPDLPPVVWQQILRDVISQNTAPASAPATAQAPPVTHQPSQPPQPPQPPQLPQLPRMPQTVPGTTTPQPLSSGHPAPPTLTTRLSELATNPGCVMGTGIGVIVIAVLIGVLVLV
ncbi:hypothetical protein CU044_1249 [Streptomyces sp. L-9-10]|uniref:hypothetical protein n=1 Tax=Streptomyces sp. L-9-10 TaxID=1478131 RepID=UPI00101CEAB3|nr:hypothetical protein [Streptomyces sp. L-9-10]RYJ30514.1 hypothetical protein CU044_1249 [Streptomyces sp. L-9-10]